ncbi:pyrroloquinoline quinone biosynthesis protein PqqB [Swaminathania salitolerans]|uniref:Coenzyme PQQ synthesis protein B n=1 Tax=Swaminathania salitolerans TaxID=182838 RepID=A0A511BXJ9_9PROT|nr:pyrroloquinoline quinone biosynthesis protein PqqB [Swaminathania salitolerans]GBQ12147.1 pyrroloquinoline quinone biosynthesis protein PqqB [Swaminathania salitolerans LMG 21291]GEL02748.1 coenzyme PQQ synthesis protein B [Swaminathania salitolerans]
MLDILVLGSAAGGGFPQWNSNAPGCRAAREGRIPARTQTSLAVSGDGQRWFLLNAAPDLRAQILANPPLHARDALRSTPIQGVLLTNGEIDSVTGLLTLREREAFTLWATRATHAQLDANPIFEAVNREIVPRLTLETGISFSLPNKDGTPSGLTVTAFDVPGKAPLYAEHLPSREGETIGLDIGDGTRRMVFLPACAELTPPILERIGSADALFMEGTLWRDDEMIRAGLSPKTGLRMGHISLSGPGGSLETLTDAPPHRVFIHINNSNPILLPGSPERSAVEAAGWSVGEDGMRLTLGAVS